MLCCVYEKYIIKFCIDKRIRLWLGNILWCEWFGACKFYTKNLKIYREK